MDAETPKTYGQRLEKAMKHAGFKTDAELARALTTALVADGLRASDKEIPQQTIQSARTRITDNGSSKYNAYFARLCRVDPTWLLNGIGEMVQRNAREQGVGWPFKFNERRYTDLLIHEKRQIERLVLALIEDFEADRSAASKPKKRKGQGR